MKKKNNLPKVLVLMSTYNGDRYLETQLESILKQNYKNIEIFVRDDGSTDKTINILKKYKKELTFVTGKNIGFVKSFFWLVNNAGDADYYAFADQDDYWLPNKIERAVSRLNKMDQNQPLLYFSDYDFYDKDLNFIRHSDTIKKPLSLLNAVTSGECCLGFNTVVNENLLKMVKKNNPELIHLYGHDHWFYLLALTMGKIDYDNFISAKYRRHEKNVSTFGKDFFQHQLWRIKNFIFHNAGKKISFTVNQLYVLYENELKKKDRKIISLFSYNGFNLLKSLKKTFYPKKLRDNFFDEIAIRIIFLIGKM